MRLLKRVYRRVRDLESALRRKLLERAARRRCIGAGGCVFTEDYVSRSVPFWERCLADLKGKPNLRMLEIGSYEGRSAIWFLENILTDPTSSMTCVDSFVRAGGEITFDHNIAVSGVAARVRKIKAPSQIALPTLEEPAFDAVYIDGSHLAPEVLMDAVGSFVLLKPGGLLLLDDYGWGLELPPLERPKLAIDLFLRAFRSRVEVLHEGYEVILRKSDKD